MSHSEFDASEVVVIDTYGATYGLPSLNEDTVIVVDVRGLADPADDDPPLGTLTGYHPRVHQAVRHTRGVLAHIKPTLDAIDARLDHGAPQVHVAIISHTGSRRSVVIGDVIHGMLAGRDIDALLRHRDILPAAAGLPATMWPTPEPT